MIRDERINAMLKPYFDCRNRCVCYADASTGLVEHEYKHVKTSTCIPIGGIYRIERENTITILTRISEREFQINSYKTAA